MPDEDRIAYYNYAVFGRQAFKMLSWENSPAIGKPAPDFPVWDIDGNETTLSAIWSQHTYTVIEFGSFT
jgi:hypothetical protein